MNPWITHWALALLAQAQQDADKMADMVRQNEQRNIAYTEQLKAKDDRIKALAVATNPEELFRTVS